MKMNHMWSIFDHDSLIDRHTYGSSSIECFTSNSSISDKGRQNETDLVLFSVTFDHLFDNYRCSSLYSSLNQNSISLEL